MKEDSVTKNERESKLIVDQPPPVAHAESVPCWDAVIIDFGSRFKHTVAGTNVETVRDVLDDMAARDAIGRERYGTPLMTRNGRDPLVDMYQEDLDAVVYMKQAMLEGEALPLGMYLRRMDDLMFTRRLINERAAKALAK